MPDPCMAIGDELAELELSQIEHQAALVIATPSEKPGLVDLIQQLEIQIEDANRRLAECLEPYRLPEV